ncbi:MAG: ImmA/IrrE family metallo-endopeptidase [Acidobacteriota bacterium]
MHFFLDKIERLKCQWNRRPLTETDFHRLCKRLKVTVVEMPLQTNGFYFCMRSRHFIAIDRRLDRYRKLLVMFHELAHCLMHAPDAGVTANFHGIGKKTRKEKEADAFALCAIIPLAWIQNGTITERAADEGIPTDIVADRLGVFEKLGL